MKGVFIMKKRVVSIILVIALMLSALSITAFAVDEGKQDAEVSTFVGWVQTILQGIHNIHAAIYSLISVLVMDLFFPIVS